MKAQQNPKQEPDTTDWDNPLPKKKIDQGGWDTVLFKEGLYYITGQTEYHEAIKRFRRFLAEDKQWPEEEIDTFLRSRADRWPPLIRSRSSNQPIAIDHPYLWLPPEPTWRDYGGFLLDELPTLKAIYKRWFQIQANKKRAKSLPHQKEKRPTIKKVA